MKTKKIRNIKGTSDNKCKCGSWLDHWAKHSRESVPSMCPEKTCTKKDLVGAHVQRADANDASWYIIPLCADHNKARGEVLELYSETTIVSASVSDTCGNARTASARR